VHELELYMKRPAPVESASALIDEKIRELGDWRGKTLAKVREIIHKADLVKSMKAKNAPVAQKGKIA
jgi:hypothetical protein